MSTRACLRVAVCATGLIALGGCPSFPEQLLEPAPDAAADAAAEASPGDGRAPGDGAADGPAADASPEAGAVDAAADAAAPDAGRDAAPADAGIDSGIDRGIDAGPDAAIDAAPADAGIDSGIDRGIDTGPDAGIDAGPDAGTVPGTWVLVPAGSFAMGSPAGEPCRSPNEDQHPVTLTRAFEIAATEVTQGDFAQLLGYNPAGATSCGSACPVEGVSWHEAAAYCNALSQIAGLASCYGCSGSGTTSRCANAAPYAGAAIYGCPGYRLPTEAEWERAYRAGTTTPLYSGGITARCNDTDPNADLIAWYGVSAPQPVGGKQPNAWNLYDMAGNVWEWVHDVYQQSLGTAAVTDPWGAASGTSRVYRGGSFFYGLKYLRGAYRWSFKETATSTDIGFRCARTR